jgi:hypothetical protein
MRAAYNQGPATSAASSARDSVPATLPHCLRYYCLHEPPPLANPHYPLQPRAQLHNRLSRQCATSSAHCRRSQAPAHTAAGRRCTQRTTEVQRRQLRHP